MTTLIHIATIPLSLRFFKGQVGYMKAHGIDVHVLTSPGPGLEEFAAAEQVTAHAIEMPRQISPLRDLIAIFHIFRLLRQVRPQMVHAHTPKGGLLGMISAFLARVPVRIYQVHGLPHVTASGYKRFLLQLSERVSCLLADDVLCVSRSLREEVIASGLCPPGKVGVIMNGSINGIDAKQCFDPALHVGARDPLRAQFGIPPDSLIIGFVGRLAGDKGIIELLEAWRLLKDEFPNLHLLLVGPADTRDRLPAAITEQLQQDDKIHLAGLVDDLQEVADYYSAMDVLALPTYREGFGLAATEASAMLLPVVASQITGCVDAVADGVTGMLVPARDASALANALRAYLRDPQLRAQHGQAGRDYVLKEFDPPQIWEALYAEYGALLRRKGQAPLP